MKNDYRIDGDIAYIKIVRVSGEVLEVMVDSTLLTSLKKCPKLYVNAKSGYPVMDFWNKGVRKHVYLHRYITKAPAGKSTHVDHINHNVLDNRLSNLRVVSASENGSNRAGASSNSRSTVLGVSWHKKAKKWMAQTKINRIYYYLGLFDSIEEAESCLIKFKAVKMAELPINS